MKSACHARGKRTEPGLVTGSLAALTPRAPAAMMIARESCTEVFIMLVLI